MKELKAVFLEKHGRESERARAIAAGFKVGETYTITNFEEYGWNTDLTFKEIPGKWNCVMFEFDREEAYKLW